MFSIARLCTVAFLVCCLFTVGCSSGKYVRHLASDACLVTPQQTTKKEVLSYMGTPDNKKAGANGEEWIYYQRHKSLLRKTPYIGDKIGSENYEAMIIAFDGDIVKSCTYRTYDEQKFKNSKLQKNNPESVDKK